MKLSEIGGGGTQGGATRMGQTIKGGDIARPAYKPASSLKKYLDKIDYSGKSVPKKTALDPISYTPKTGLRKELEKLNLIKPRVKPAAKAPKGINPKSYTPEPNIKKYLKDAGL